ncbi:MAG: hypothetical protein N3E45_15785 [Oscillatoriaceae bacterium SKW80]|nr:hypothetical protein [Oscillatoriaceae bacterium SKYG93]MCX8122259.1 hypothetical protein [Oscillatoriaceae bacterium SKW80]MDW8454545.1 hypothetical protein [Oscillatoriaceae cyanobacterium SKYGB_i_bin93]
MDRNFANLTKADIPAPGANSYSASKLFRSRIVSYAPGRIRLKVSHQKRIPQYLEALAEKLQEHPDITEVRINVKTGSIVIHYNHNQSARDAVYSTLKDLGIIFSQLNHGESYAGAEVANAFAELNQRVAEATSGKVDLRFLIPLGLGTLAIRQLLVKGLQLESVPWYVLAWYAFDSFIKLHYTHKGQPRESYELPPNR